MEVKFDEMVAFRKLVDTYPIEPRPVTVEKRGAPEDPFVSKAAVKKVPDPLDDPSFATAEVLLVFPT